MHRSAVEDLGGGVLDRAPHLFRSAALAVVLVAGPLLAGCQPDARVASRTETAATPTHPAAADPDAYARSLLDLVNAERAVADLTPLTRSACADLQAGARAAALVAAGGALEHAPLPPVTEACAPASMSGENLSRAAAPPADVVAAWMASPGHRSNILAAGFTETAVACLSSSAAAAGEVLCSQVFLGP